jgi:hypothetical protein
MSDVFKREVIRVFQSPDNFIFAPKKNDPVAAEEKQKADLVIQEMIDNGEMLSDASWLNDEGTIMTIQKTFVSNETLEKFENELATNPEMIAWLTILQEYYTKNNIAEYIAYIYPDSFTGTRRQGTPGLDDIIGP